MIQNGQFWNMGEPVVMRIAHIYYYIKFDASIIDKFCLVSWYFDIIAYMKKHVDLSFNYHMLNVAVRYIHRLTGSW